MKYGFAGSIKSINSNTGQAFLYDPGYKNFTAIVKDILLLDTQRKEFFKDFNGSYDTIVYPIGTIKFQRAYSNIAAGDTFQYAIPETIHGMIYPKPGEMINVNLSEGFDAQTEQGSSKKIFVYSKLLTSWNNVEHNIVPKDSLFGNNKEQNSIKNYKEAEAGTPLSSQAGSVYHDENLGNVKNIYPMYDNIIQGRGGTSIRVGTSYGDVKEVPWKGPKGKPVLILRNGQSKKADADNVFEDINNDGSSFYILSEQSIDLNIACLNFDSFDVSIENKKNKDITVVKKPIVENDVSNVKKDDVKEPDVKQTITPVAIKQTPVSSSMKTDDDSLPDNEDQLAPENLETLEVPVTNGIVNSVLYLESNFKLKLSGGVTSDSVNDIGQMPILNTGINGSAFNYIGHVSNVSGMSPAVKALLDVIAYMEGTAGRGDFDGYDVYYNYRKILGFTSWDSNPLHPKIKIVFNDKGEVTTAAGRYQFTYTTWSYLMGKKVGLSKENQDRAAWKRMLENVSQNKIDSIGSDNFSTFVEVIGGKKEKPDPNCLAGIWASLPSSYYGAAGYYGQNTTNKHSFEQLWDFYKKAYIKYT